MIGVRSNDLCLSITQFIPLVADLDDPITARRFTGFEWSNGIDYFSLRWHHELPAFPAAHLGEGSFKYFGLADNVWHRLLQ